MKTPMLDRITDFLAPAWLAGFFTGVIYQIPWTQLSAMAVFFWTFWRMIMWFIRKYHLWKIGRSLDTITKDD